MVRGRSRPNQKDPDDYGTLLGIFTSAYLSPEGQELMRERPYLEESLALFTRLGMLPDREAEFKSNGLAIEESVKNLAQGLDVLTKGWLRQQGDTLISAEIRKGIANHVERVIEARVIADDLPKPKMLGELDGICNENKIARIAAKYTAALNERRAQGKQSFTSQISQARGH